MSRRCLFVVGLVLLVRIAALPLPGTEDVRVWKIWAYHASAHVTEMYGVGGTPPTRGVLRYRGRWTTVDYPPGALYVLGAAGAAYSVIDSRFDDTWRLTVAVKLPGLLAGIALTAWLYAIARRLSGSVRVGEYAALAFWANPATMLNAEVLGYLDPLVMLPVVPAVVWAWLSVQPRAEAAPATASTRWPAGRAAIAAGMAAGVALMMKPQAMLIGPACVATLLRVPRRLVSAAVACAGTIALCLAPFAVTGALPNMWIAMGSWQARRDIMSGTAANLWWIVTWIERAYFMVPEFGLPGAYLEPVLRPLAISSFMEVGFPNPRPLGTALVVACVAWAWWQTRGAHSLVSRLLLAAFTVHAFFVCALSVHEHHLMLAVPLLALAAALSPAVRGLLVAVSAVCALNMYLFYGIGLGADWRLSRRVTGIDASVVLACVDVGLLLWHARVVRHHARGVA